MERKVILFWVWVTIFVVWSVSFFSTLATTDLPLPVRVRFGVIITFTLATLAAVSYVTHEVWPRGISSDEDLERARQKDIWKAIKKWVGDGAKILSIQTDGETRISYTYPLAAEPPELVVEIKYCLSQNYPSLWNERGRFLTRKIEYAKKIFGTKEEMSAAREALHDDYKTLEKHFKSEIIEKHYSRLRT
ncbi:MAG: hypothetical protein HYZ12_00880 [Thaumarchaeota archaeon]|nr:hypothetical protein [Nitrososphaerota archaeon]